MLEKSISSFFFFFRSQKSPPGCCGLRWSRHPNRFYRNKLADGRLAVKAEAGEPPSWRFSILWRVSCACPCGSASFPARRTSLVTGLPQMHWGSEAWRDSGPFCSPSQLLRVEGSGARSIFPGYPFPLWALCPSNPSSCGTKTLSFEGIACILSVCNFH